MSTKADIVSLKDSYGKFIVRPLAQFGFGGFVFDIDRDTQIELTAQITDHYVEDNSVINDVMAVQPLRVTLRNYVGELVYEKTTASSTNTINKVAQKLTTVSSFVAPVSSAFSSLKSLAEQDSIDFTEGTEDLSNLWALTKNLNPNATKQQQAYLYFKALQSEKILLSLETPFEFLQNMVVESVVARQTEESQYISEFSITLKQIRVNEAIFTEFNNTKLSSIIADQQKAVTDVIGRTQGKAQSLLLDAFEGLF